MQVAASGYIPSPVALREALGVEGRPELKEDYLGRYMVFIEERHCPGRQVGPHGQQVA